jgi:diacylglycerol kinase (ATP)
MRALAILGPKASEPDLAPFRAAGAGIMLGENLTEMAAGEKADAVLVLGGDGTVQRHLASLVKAQIPLLAVPSGSANDFARALGVRTRAQALRTWEAFLHGGHNVRSIDLGRIEFAGEGSRATREPTYFCCAMGTGVDAEVARRANSLPRWLRGRGGYFLAAIPALLRFRAQLITLTASGKPTISEPGILVAAANAPWYGHGMNIAPQAELDDEQLEICFVRGMGKLRLLRLFPRVYRGTHIGLREVEYFRARRLGIESETPLAVHADGELVGQTPMEVNVAPRALRVIV